LVGVLGSMAGPVTAAGPAGAHPTVEVEDIRFGADGQEIRTSGTAGVEFTQPTGLQAAKTDAVRTLPAVKVSPRFAELQAATAKSDQRVKVLVSFVEDQQIPLLPSRDDTQPDTAAVNVAVQARIDAMVQDVRTRREPAYKALRADFARLGGTVLDTYWLSKSVYAEIPRSAVATLAARADVRYVEPSEGTIRPMDNTEAAARALMNTDPYFTTGRTTDRVAILDTGVQADSLLLNTGTSIGFGIDFTGEGSAFTDMCNHGTKTAAVIAGNNVLGNAYRGIGGIKVDVYKVFPNLGDVDHRCLGDGDVLVAALDSAVAHGEKVIVGALGDPDDTENSTEANHADSAFDAGAVVIMANGNSGPGPGTVNSPGNARKVLGIGAVDVETFARFPEQSEGPTRDGRTKPDLVAPTDVETGSAFSSEVTSIFHKTSAATAEAGGAAAVWRNFLRGSATDIEPGHVYAGMILGGSNAGNVLDNVQGAGKLRLTPKPPTSNAVYKKFSLTDLNGSSVGVTIPFTVSASTPSTCRLSGSLWWGETAGARNDFDIQLIDPNGVIRASSASGPSVFELARVDGPLQPGAWKIKVFPFHPVVGTQKVYGAAATCR
jgi:hypothetical protein